MLTLSDKTFDKYLQDDMPLLVMFTAEFAGPCNLADPIFTEARNRKGNQIRFAKFDIDGNVKTPAIYGVKQLPLFVLFKDQKPVEVVGGAVPLERLLEMIDGI